MKTLLMLGDSLIEWGDWQQRFPNCSVINGGIAGETVQGLRRRLPEILRRVDEPDGVVVMTGTNNLAVDDLYFIEDYEEIVRSLIASCPKPMVAVTSLLPMNFPWQPATVVATLNSQLQDLCIRTNCAFVDLYTPFQAGLAAGEELFDADGVHLASAGYGLWGKVLLETFSWL